MSKDIRQELLDLGFEEVPHFTITNSLNYDLGRNRFLSIGDVGNPNEMMFIKEMSFEDKEKVEDLVCVHNYDFDGFMTIEKMTALITGLT